MNFVQNPVPADSPAATNLRAGRSRVDGWLIATLCGTAMYLYLRLFNFHGIPFLLSGDQMFYWLNGMRILAGDRIYQDFFRFLPPGIDLFYAAAFKVFGTRIWVPNLIVLTLGIGYAWACFALSAKLVSRPLACLAAGMFTVFIYGKAINATHHWFAVLAIAVAVNVLMTGTSRARLAAAGATLAVAAFFNQVHGGAALLAVCLFLLWKHFSRSGDQDRLLPGLAVLFSSFAIPFLFLDSYFIAQSGWKRIWESQVVFILKYPGHLSGTPSLGLGESPAHGGLFAAAPYLLIYILLPAVYCMALWLCWSRKDAAFPRERVALLALTGLLLLAEVGTAINWLRVYAVSLPGIVLFMWIVAQKARRIPCAAGLASALLLGLGVQQIVSIHRANSVEANLPGGTLATNPPAYDKLNWIAQRTQPGELFFQAQWPGMYLPLQLRNPLYLPTVSPYDLSSLDDLVSDVQRLKSKPVHFILWSPLLDRDCGPGAACADSISPFRDDLHASYTCVHTFSDGDTLWERNE